MSDAPAAGHNLPDLASTLAPDAIAALIEIEAAPLKARADELIASCRRFIIAHPSIGSDETDALAAQVLAVCNAFAGKSGRVEKTRVEFLKPIREATLAVGSYDRGPFSAVAQSVTAVAAAINKASIAYKLAKEADARKRRQEEADRLAAEAAELEAAAQQGHATYDDAAAAYANAERAQEGATVKSAELTRSHGDALGTTSLRYKRTVIVVEPDKVPRQYCVPDLGLLRHAAGKAGGPLPIIAGCNIVDEPDLTVRR